MKKIKRIRKVIKEWLEKQGHESCHYYPEIFKEICDILEIEYKIPDPGNISINEFAGGCLKFQKELFKL